MKAYERRNRLLKSLGFKSYQDYLNSDLWRKIRASRLSKHPECYACPRKATQVHHKRYTLAVMLGHEPQGLVAVCGGCHYRAEFTQDGDKRDLRQANKSLRKIQASHQFNAAKMLGAWMFMTLPETVDDQYRARLDREL